MRRRLQEAFRNKDVKPSPNQYNPRLPWSEKMASLKGMHKESKSLKTPGPASHMFQTNLFNGPQYTLAARNIPFQDAVYVAPNPGPCDYNPDAKLTLAKSPVFSLGSRESKSISKDDVPGPIYYPQNGQIQNNKNPKVTIKGRYKKPIDSMPGPSDYFTGTIGKTKSETAKKNTIQRVEEQIKPTIEETPGPSDYQLEPISTVKCSGPKFSLRQRLETKQRN